MTKGKNQITIPAPFFVKSLLAAGAIAILLSCSKKSSGGGGTTPPPDTLAAEITILSTDLKQVIQGFGCATVFRPANTSLTATELDRLFGNNNGQVGLNILRIRLASDNNWRALELANAQGAIQRGAIVMATPWSPPASMKSNNSIIGGTLLADSSEAYAKYLDDFAAYMESSGAPLYAVSVQNEPDISVGYESCDWTAPQMRDFIKNYGQLVTHARLMAPESFNNNQTFVNTILNDDAAVANLDLVGGHIYGSGVDANPLAAVKGKEVWMTEHLDTNITYAANLGTAEEIHDCLTRGQFNAYVWWYGKRFYGPIGEDGQVTKRGFIMSQFARFISPGSTRLGTGSNSNSDVAVSAYQNPSGKLTIVAINTSDKLIRQKFILQGGTLHDMTPYTTSESDNVKQGSNLGVSSNSVSVVLPPRSVTTLIEP